MLKIDATGEVRANYEQSAKLNSGYSSVGRISEGEKKKVSLNSKLLRNVNFQQFRSYVSHKSQKKLRVHPNRHPILKNQLLEQKADMV